MRLCWRQQHCFHPLPIRGWWVTIALSTTKVIRLASIHTGPTSVAKRVSIVHTKLTVCSGAKNHVVRLVVLIYPYIPFVTFIIILIRALSVFLGTKKTPLRHTPTNCVVEITHKLFLGFRPLLPFRPTVFLETACTAVRGNAAQSR